MTDDQAPGGGRDDGAAAPTDPTAPAPTAAARTGEWEIAGARMAALTAYLEVHRDRFTEAALRRAAAEAGYTPDEIDTAWTRLERGGSGDPSRPPLHAGVAFLTFIGWLAAIWLGGSLLNTLAFLGSSGLPVGLLLWAGSGVLGALIWWTQRDTHPSLALGVGLGVVVVVLLPLVLILVILGICLATGTTLFGN